MALVNDETTIIPSVDVTNTEGILIYGSDGSNLSRQIKTDSGGSVSTFIVSGSNASAPVTVNGTVTANIGTTNGIALDATLTGGTQKSITRGGAKGTSVAADVTSVSVDANTQALHVQLAGQGTAGAALRVDPTGLTTQPISAASLPLPTGAATESTLTGVLTTTAFQARVNTLGQKTMAASMPVVIASDQSAIQISGSVGIDAFPALAVNGGTLKTLNIGVGGTANGTDFRVLNTDGNGRLIVNPIINSNGVVNSAVPASASYSGLRNIGGNLIGWNGDNSGAGYVSFKEESVSGTLGALNAEIRIALSGSTGVGFQLNAGTLVGTLSAEISYDNGTTWVGTGFYDVDTKGLADTIVFATSNTAQTKGIMIPQGGGLVRVRVSAFTSGTATGNLRTSFIPPQVIYTAPLDGRRATYSGYTAAFASAATATDIFVIQGSATRTIRVLLVEIYATQTTAGAGNIFLIKRNTANTGGTAVATTRVPYDSGSPAATATVQHYTANPTVGGTVGNVKAYRGIIPAPATLINNPICKWEFGNKPGSAVVLKGTAESLVVNLAGVTITGGSFIIGIEWTEE